MIILGTLVVVVQVMVFCLLTSIYIALATEHEDHGADAKGHGEHGEAEQAPQAGARVEPVSAHRAAASARGWEPR